MREYMVYDWYYKKITPEKSNEELLEIVKKNKKMFYAHEDVYFRKANFVYRFFQPYLDDEKCIVTTDMVKELLAKTDKVIAAAQADGVITPNGILDKKYFVCEDYYELTDEAAKKEYERAEKEQKEMPRNWVKVAEEELPTTSGFFFGGTEYDVFYLQDILSCKEQFTELLENWKPNEIVYNIMSW